MRKKLRGLQIIGEDTLNGQRIYINREDCVTIDLSKNLISQIKFRELLAEYEITEDTRIDLICHGRILNEDTSNPTHSIALLNDVEETSNVLKIISEQAMLRPIQAHIWSCFGGLSAKAVSELPNGSVVLAHGPEKSTIRFLGAVYGIDNSIKKTLEQEQPMRNIAKNLVENLCYYSQQDLSIGIKTTNGNVIVEKIAEPTNMILENSAQATLMLRSMHIQSIVEKLKSDGEISHLIETPSTKEYSDIEITDYKFQRILYDVFMRKDTFSPNFDSLIEFSKAGTRESQPENLKLAEEILLTPHRLKQILDIENSNGKSILQTIIESFSVNDSAYKFIIEEAKKINYFNNRRILHKLCKSLAQQNNPSIVKRYFENITFPQEYINIIRDEAIKSYNPLVLSEIILDCEFSTEQKSTHVFLEALTIKYEKIENLINSNNFRDEEYFEKLFRLAKNNNYFANESNLENFYNTMLDSDNELLLKYFPEILNITPDSLIDRISNNIFSSNNEQKLSKIIDIWPFSDNEKQSKLYKDTLFKKHAKKAMEDGNYEYLEKISSGIEYRLKEEFYYSAIEIGNFKAAEIILPNLLSQKIIEGDTDSVTKLLEKGVNPNKLSSEGFSPLALSIYLEKTDMIKLLIAYGADTEENIGSSTHLHNSIIEQKNNIALALIESGANVSISDSEGRTPLSLAIALGENDIIRSLLSNGASPRETYKGSEIINQAIVTNNINLMKIFIESGMDINLRDKYGSSVLTKAVFYNKPDMVSLLLSNGAKHSETPSENIKLLNYAERKGYIEIHTILSSSLEFEKTSRSIDLANRFRCAIESKTHSPKNYIESSRMETRNQAADIIAR